MIKPLHCPKKNPDFPWINSLIGLTNYDRLFEIEDAVDFLKKYHPDATEIIGKKIPKAPQERKTQLCQLLKESLEIKDYYGAAMITNALKGFIEYHKTKKVDNALLPFFDQDGNWYGYGIYTKKNNKRGYGISNNYSEVFGNLHKEILPKERIIHTDEFGNPHLLSSFILNKSGIAEYNNLELPYQSIGGYIEAPYAQTFSAPKLALVVGKLNLRGASEFSCPKLAHIGWYADLSNVKNLLAPELVRVGEYLGATKSSEVLLPKLQEILGGLKAPNAQNLHIPKLKKAPQGLDIKEEGFKWLKVSQIKTLLYGLLESENLNDRKNLNPPTPTATAKRSIEKLNQELEKRRGKEQALKKALGAELEL